MNDCNIAKPCIPLHTLAHPCIPLHTLAPPCIYSLALPCIALHILIRYPCIFTPIICKVLKLFKLYFQIVLSVQTQYTKLSWCFQTVEHSCTWLLRLFSAPLFLFALVLDRVPLFPRAEPPCVGSVTSRVERTLLRANTSLRAVVDAFVPRLAFRPGLSARRGRSSLCSLEEQGDADLSLLELEDPVWPLAPPYKPEVDFHVFPYVETHENQWKHEGKLVSTCFHLIPNVSIPQHFPTLHLSFFPTSFPLSKLFEGVSMWCILPAYPSNAYVKASNLVCEGSKLKIILKCWF